MNVVRRLLFNSHGRLGVINADGTDESYLQLDAPGQQGWGWGPVFSDRRRVILSSYEDMRTWVGTVQSHLWIYDLNEGRLLEEIGVKDRPAPFMVCAGLLPGEQRMVAGPVIDGEQRVWTMNLDGSEPREVTEPKQGFTYCVQLSPDKTRFAFHATMIPDRPGYGIFTTDVDGGDRVEVAGDPEHLYFGPVWSPDGAWLAYLDCEPGDDPGHDRANLCLGRPDGSEHRVVTNGRRHWFGTSFGGPDTRGSGSNMTGWSPDGRFLTFTRMAPGSQTAWVYRPDRPDTDHFNRDYHPEAAKGGTAICLLNPCSGAMTEVVPYQSGVWNFRAAWSPGGSMLAFCRSAVGEPSGLWLSNADGSALRLLTCGFEGRGADHPVWV